MAMHDAIATKPSRLDRLIMIFIPPYFNPLRPPGNYLVVAMSGEQGVVSVGPAIYNAPFGPDCVVERFEFQMSSIVESAPIGWVDWPALERRSRPIESVRRGKG
jgi:hypothetical protein